MEEEIEEICNNSMLRILDFRPNQNENRKTFTVYIADDVKEKLSYLQVPYKFMITTYTLGPSVKWWIIHKTCANPQQDISKKITYDSEEWTAYTFVFAHENSQKFSPEIYIKSHADSIKLYIKSLFEKYLNQRNEYDHKIAEFYVANVLEDLYGFCKKELPYFYFSVEVMILQKGCGYCSTSRSVNCEDSDGIIYGIYDNEGYECIAYVKAIAA